MENRTEAVENTPDKLQRLIEELKGDLEDALHYKEILEITIPPGVVKVVEEVRNLDRDSFSEHLDLSSAAMDKERRIVGAIDGRGTETLRAVASAYQRAIQAVRGVK